MKRLIFTAMVAVSGAIAQDTQQSMQQIKQLATQTADKIKAELDAIQIMSDMMIGGKVVKGAPYSATAVNTTTQTLGDGNHINRSTSSQLYRDSEGRERREESLGGKGGAVFISDPVEGVRYTLEPNNHVARKTPTPPTMTARDAKLTAEARTLSADAKAVIVGDHTQTFTFSTSGGGVGVGGGGGRGGNYVINYNETKSRKANVEHLGTQVIEGVSAEGTRTTVTIPAGEIGNERDINIVSENWYSQELQMNIMTKHSDPRTGETIYKLTNISRAEPSRTMFEVPPDYTVKEAGTVHVMGVPTHKDEQ